MRAYRHSEDIVAAREQEAMGAAPIRKWPSYSAQIRHTLNVTSDFAPWTTRKDVRLHGVPQDCRRILDVIDVAWIHALRVNAEAPEEHQKTMQDLRKEFFVDVSQAVQRRPWSRGCARTLHTGSLLYSFEVDCLFSSIFLLRLHGYPARLNADCVSHREAQLLAGESWALPTAGMILYAAFLAKAAPWWHHGPIVLD